VADNKALDAVINQITKQYGEGSIMRLGGDQIIPVEAISTGSLALDTALGIGGLPKGRIVEIFGAESSGKTTLALHVAAEAQKAGGVAAFVDAEHALDPLYAKRLGVDIDNLLISQPDTGEQALEITDMLVRSGAVDVVVVDSVAALVPRAELEGEMGDTHVGLQARLMSQALRKLAGNISKTRACVVFVNQIREKIGVMFGSPITTPGGRALKFAASIRLQIRKMENVKTGMDITGTRTEAKVVKNKFAPPFRNADFEIVFGTGICKYGDLIDMGLKTKALTQKGSWFTYGEERIGQGRERVKQNLRENPDLYERLLQDVKSRIAETGADVVAPDDDDA
jgi:recombination protein RecA